ncbi:hypothetical protein BGZ94_003740, partial [Podila epigama]
GGGDANSVLAAQLISFIVIVWSLLVIYSRVHLYYHTWQQVVAGTICGIIFAVVYYVLVNRFLRSKGVIDWVVDHPWARMVHVRDSDAVHDINRFDWEMWQQWRKTRLSKVD